MNYIFFTKYTTKGASSRQRFYQYFQEYQSRGLKFSVSPLFDDDYLVYKYSTGKIRVLHVLRAILRRVFTVLLVPPGTIAIIEYELIPWFPAILERWLLWRGCKIIVDYDDAIFHQYDTHPSALIRLLLGHKIRTVMQLAHYVVVGNRYLYEYALLSGSKRIELIPTVINLDQYRVKNSPFKLSSPSKSFTIGWIGSPSTASYLNAIAPALVEVCSDGKSVLRLIGSGSISLSGIPVDLISWNEETAVDHICSFDIGIMPLIDDPWARGKCGFKLIQYMGCGIPVVASPVGVNCEIVTHGVNGYLASTVTEWVDIIKLLQRDIYARHRMGLSGRQRVEDCYNLSVTIPLWLHLLNEICSD